MNYEKIQFEREIIDVGQVMKSTERHFFSEYRMYVS
jgi:hypothetical protein